MRGRRFRFERLTGMMETSLSLFGQGWDPLAHQELVQIGGAPHAMSVDLDPAHRASEPHVPIRLRQQRQSQ